MKIGILTFHVALNVGAQLQALALFRTLVDLGHDAEFIRYEPKYLKKPYRFFRNVNVKNGIASCVKQTLLHIIYDACTWIKTKRHYTGFQKKYYAFTSTRFSRLSELANADFDAIIVGSDQIWNPEITNGCLDRFYTLDFKSDRIRKISYAASFSQSHITQSDTLALIECLKSFRAISVREEGLKLYLNSFCNLHVNVVLDPTLLLTKRQWVELMPKQRIIAERYVLLYQARGEKKKILAQATNLADKLHAKVYDASGMNYRIRRRGKQYVSPIEFLNLIYFAEAVVTISFHGTALSLILEKPFFSICLNDGRDGRVENLLKTVGLLQQLKTPEDVWDCPVIDYSQIESCLEEKRKESLLFLNKALDNGYLDIQSVNR